MIILDSILFIYSVFCLSLFVTDYSFIHPSVSINNPTIPTLGLFFLLILRWVVDRKNFINSMPARLFFRFQKISDWNLVLLLCGFTFILFSSLSIVRHLSLNSRALDLGIFDQGIWNASQGNSLFCTIKWGWGQGGDLLGDHFEPILFLIAPLYKLYPNVSILLILQSFLLTSAIVPLFLIAKLRMNSRSVIFAFLISYSLSKSLRGIAFFDFYPESFIIPALFWGYYFLIKKNNALLWLNIIVLLLCKEDTTFLILGFGLFALFVQKRRTLGISFIATAILLWILETKIIIPYFSPTHTYAYMAKLPFGATYSENLIFVLTHPLSFIKFIFLKCKIVYILRLLSPLCFLSVLSPPHYILFLIPLLKNLVAGEQNPLFFTINQHYHAGIIPFIYIGAIYGCGWLLEKFKITKSYIVALVLIFFSLIFYGRSEGGMFAKFISNMKTNHTLEKIKYLNMIPPQASVSASPNLCPHLSHRKHIYVLHFGTLKKFRFSDADSNGAKILETLIQKGVYENVSSTEVRLKRNPDQFINRPAEMASSHFDEIWQQSPIWNQRVLPKYIVIDKSSPLDQGLSNIDDFFRNAENLGYTIIFRGVNNFIVLYNKNISE